MKIPAIGVALVSLQAFGISDLNGQLNLNAGVSYAEALGGQWGIEGRVGWYPHPAPVDFFGGGEYFFADCTNDCSLWGGRLGATLHTDSPDVQPFLSAALVGRSWKRGEAETDRLGPALGGGVRLVWGKVRFQAEVSREFLKGDLNQWVFRIGTG